MTTKLAEKRKKAPRPPGAGKRGPLPLPIDLKQVEELGKLQCTEAEMAAVLKISEDTVTRRLQKDTAFYEAYHQGKKNGKVSLRREQWLTAQGARGDRAAVTMQVWLGKQYLGQSDKQELGGEGGGPLVLKVVYEKQQDETKALQ